LLLWSLMLAGWGAAVTFFSRHLPTTLRARVLAVMGLIAVGFLLFLLATSNPFARLSPPAPEGQDATFKPDFVVENGQRIELGEMSGGLTLRAIHTPGHASNHLCYLLEQTKMLFTGDHVMQGSTVVINPPDGEMRAYLASLERLLAEDIAIIAPGHGYLIGAPHKEVRRLIAHRLNRERKVVAALVKLEHPSLEEMLPLVYDDVPERIHRVAARSLTAHLDKLVAEGAVRLEESRYTLVRSA